MFDSINKVLTNVFSNKEEKEEGFSGRIIVQPSGSSALIAFILTVFLYLAIVSAIGMFLWNNVLTKLVSGVKPAKSIWQILGLVLLTQLLFN